MNCPSCDAPGMIVGEKMECRTGNAQKFICRKCRAWHWQQITFGEGGMNFRPVRETINRLATLTTP